ncbi:hypothetical protein [Sphingobacterium sp. ML3W]|uniref:hypothetical protein n=1 Tax=Sphingobacterium sp. ML3W TaxID=1538644 RepID=UPI001185E283|nr:hypothetical protein [Sphingobacterium sp. ML3W]
MVHSLRKELICFPEFFSFSRLSEYVKIVSSNDGRTKLYSSELPIDGSRLGKKIISRIFLALLRLCAKEWNSCKKNSVEKLASPSHPEVMTRGQS